MKKVYLLALLMFAPTAIAQVAIPITNAASTGTTVNETAIINSSNNAILAGTSNTAVPTYIVVANAGTTGQAQLAIAGPALCVMDATTTSAGWYYVLNSTTTNGYCHPQSAAPTAGSWVIGYLQAAATTSGVTGLVNVNSYIFGGSGGGGSSNFQVNGTGLSSSATVNFENSAATNGLTITFANPSAGNVQLGLSGTLTNAGLANSAITIAGNSVPLGGSTSAFPSPGPIGGTTPSTGAFTTLSASTSLTLGAITGSSQCLQVNTSGVVSGTGSACGSGGGSSVWSSLTNPTTNLALTMAANTTSFTFGATTGTSDLFKWTDSASNTGTGILGHFTTASSSTEIPWQADANGTGWKVNPSGQLASLGTGNSTIAMSGSTSGTVTQTVPNIAGTATVTWGNSTGTPAVTASSPLAINTTTGNIACATCATTTNGGALSASAPLAISAGGAITITGAAGQVLAGATPAFTATPTLGASGTLGSLTFGNATSGLLTLQTATGAITTYTIDLPVAQPSGLNTYLSCAAASTAVCTWAAGGSGLSGLTTGVIPQAASATSLANTSPQLDNAVTNANSLTYAGTGGLYLSGSGAKLFVGASAPAPTVGTGGGAIAVEGTAFTGISGDDGWYANSTNHCVDVINATTDVGCVATASNTLTMTNKTLTSPTFGGTVAGANTIPLSILAQVGANTTLVNVTGSTANVTAAAIPSGIQNYVAGTGYNQATGHQLQVPLACPDSSGSGTAQSCSTGGTTYTPAAYDCVLYSTTTTNSGTGLTVNVNSLGAKSVAVPGSSGWTTTLTTSLVPANKPSLMCYDGTNWDLQQTGTAGSGGGGSGTVSAAAQYDIAYYTQAGTTAQVGGAAISGFQYDSTSGAPAAATAANLGTLINLATSTIPKSGGTSSALVASSATDNGTVFATTEGVSFAPTSTSQVALVANNPTSTTANIANFEVNGAVEASIGNGGALVEGTANCTTFGTAGGLCVTEGTSATNVSGTSNLYPDSTAHEWKAATNGSTSYGIINRTQPGSISSTGLTAAVSTATLCAASAGACNVAGQYHVRFNLWGSGTACSSVTAGGVTPSLTWTDENSVSHAAVIVPLLAQTSATAVALESSAPTMPAQTALANESASGDYTLSLNGSTALQYAVAYTACTTGTLTYNIRATVTRVQ